MFEDYSSYEKDKVRLFLKYLAYASSRHVKKQRRNLEIVHEQGPKYLTRKELIENSSYKQILQERLSNINEERRNELENKISVHYSNNKFLPYENKLKKLKAKYTRLKNSKVKNKTKLKNVKEKIESCDFLLKKLKKAEFSLTENQVDNKLV